MQSGSERRLGKFSDNVCHIIIRWCRDGHDDHDDDHLYCEIINMILLMQQTMRCLKSFYCLFRFNWYSANRV